MVGPDPIWLVFLQENLDTDTLRERKPREQEEEEGLRRTAPSKTLIPGF